MDHASALDIELSRHLWASFRSRGDVGAVPAAILALSSAQSQREAQDACWQLDRNVVFQRAVHEAALPTTSCIMVALPRASELGRIMMLELLVEICSGEPDAAELAAGNIDLVERCVREVTYGHAYLLALLTSKNHLERVHCVDLVGMCAERDSCMAERAKYHLERSLDSFSEYDARSLREWIRSIPSDENDR